MDRRLRFSRRALMSFKGKNAEYCWERTAEPWADQLPQEWRPGVKPEQFTGGRRVLSLSFKLLGIKRWIYLHFNLSVAVSILRLTAYWRGNASQLLNVRRGKGGNEKDWKETAERPGVCRVLSSIKVWTKINKQIQTHKLTLSVQLLASLQLMYYILFWVKKNIMISNKRQKNHFETSCDDLYGSFNHVMMYKCVG